MNQLQAVITHIENVDNLNIVSFDFCDIVLTMMSLELRDDIKVGTKVRLVINPSHIALAKNFTGEISHSNTLDSTILSVDNGKLLSSIRLKVREDSVLESIITLSSAKHMNLEVGDNVSVFINASELAILDVL